MLWIPLRAHHLACDSANRSLYPDTISLMSKNDVSKPWNSILWAPSARATIDLSTQQIPLIVTGCMNQMFQWQETTHHDVASRTKTRLTLQHRIMLLSWRRLQVATPPPWMPRTRWPTRPRAVIPPGSPRPRPIARIAGPTGHSYCQSNQRLCAWSSQGLHQCPVHTWLEMVWELVSIWIHTSFNSWLLPLHNLRTNTPHPDTIFKLQEFELGTQVDVKGSDLVKFQRKVLV